MADPMSLNYPEGMSLDDYRHVGEIEWDDDEDRDEGPDPDDARDARIFEEMRDD